jgi:hypothetical protein
VVRPDRYVLGTANDAEGLHELLGRWRAYAVETIPTAG